MTALGESNIKKNLGVIILIIVLAAAGIFFFNKRKEDQIITYSTSDAANLKGEISIALDSWIGYFPFRSPVFGKLMRDEGYRIKVIDDLANYPERMKMLKKGKVDFAVCTVDSYLLNGKAVNYPGVIVTIIDESKGGDAIVSWKSKVANIEQLKKKKDYKIAFTPASPSEHLLKSIAVHFDISHLREKEAKWRIEVNGAEEAYKMLMKKKADLAVVWEPHVTEALINKEITKIIGSEDVEKLIVDILLVNRKYANQKSELVKIFLKKYYETLNIYNNSPVQLTKDIVATIDLEEKQVKPMLKGVKWINYPENMIWFGLTGGSGHREPQIIESINGTIDILLGNKDFSENPLPDNDPYTICNSFYLKELYNTLQYNTEDLKSASADSLSKKFSKLSVAQWNSLKIVGSLKLRPISFRSGTSVLDENGRKQVRLIVNNIRHYPNFRILIKGHSGKRGDPAANLKLSKDRAVSVQNELKRFYNVDENRIRIIGLGSKEPLLKRPDESSRSYNNRLKRVELLLLSDKK